jgi:hypothetical protein
MKAQILETADRITREQEHRSQVHQRLRLQNQVLEDLGLDEIEAIEYAMMLSIEDAKTRNATTTEQGDHGGDWQASNDALYLPSSDYPQYSDKEGSILHSVPISGSRSQACRQHSSEGRNTSSSICRSPMKREESEAQEKIEENFPPIAGSASPSSTPSTRGMSWIAAVKASGAAKSPTLATEAKLGDTAEAGTEDLEADSDLRYALELSLLEARSQFEK